MVYIPKKPIAENRGKSRKSKYGNKRVEYMKRMFDSVGERDRYIFLKNLERMGEIKNLRCQVSFDLEVNGVLICRYIADFVYERNIGAARNGMKIPKGGSIDFDFMAWTPVVEDFKGVFTDIFKLKAKLMKACYDIDVKVVKRPTDPT